MSSGSDRWPRQWADPMIFSTEELEELHLQLQRSEVSRVRPDILALRGQGEQGTGPTDQSTREGRDPASDQKSSDIADEGELSGTDERPSRVSVLLQALQGDPGVAAESGSGETGVSGNAGPEQGLDSSSNALAWVPFGLSAGISLEEAGIMISSGQTRVAERVDAPPPIPTNARGKDPDSVKKSKDRSIGNASTAEFPTITDPWYHDVFQEDYFATVAVSPDRQIQREVDFIENSLGPTPASHILDIGCGQGQHAIELAARGFRISAIDQSEGMIRRARAGSKARDVEVIFRQQEMQSLDAVAAYDAVYCMDSVFGILDEGSNWRLLGRIARALRAGGRLLLDIVNRDYASSRLPARIGWEGDGCVVLDDVRFDYTNSRFVNTRSLVFPDGRHREMHISLRAYSLHEIGRFLHRAGFGVLEVSGHIAHRGVFFGAVSPSIFILAEKSEKKRS